MFQFGGYICDLSHVSLTFSCLGSKLFEDMFCSMQAVPWVNIASQPAAFPNEHEAAMENHNVHQTI